MAFMVGSLVNDIDHRSIDGRKDRAIPQAAVATNRQSEYHPDGAPPDRTQSANGFHERQKHGAAAAS
ncbi:hypothetical protein [Bradyrhizobium sp. HKCCYLS2038]|uniref:hypothetical protein n=1 Tax=Bradyrhizobium sp. HKCCYLS2038 TaxID=3420764 RepID=UPI003EBDF33E